jgi:hypothetical protein
LNATRPRPFLDFVGGLFRPACNWFGLIGDIPKLIYLAVACVVLLVVIQFLKLFKRG